MSFSLTCDMPEKKQENEGILSKSYHCPECESENIVTDYDVGENVCGGCGLVVKENKFDYGPDWNAFTKEEKEKKPRAELYSTPTLHDEGRGSIIDCRDKDAYGKKIKPDQRAQTYRLRKWQKRIRVSNAAERNLSIGLGQVGRMSDNLNLPKNVFESAAVVYRKATKEGIIRGRSVNGVAAASVYVACRQCGIPKIPDEISKASDIDKRELRRTYNYIVKTLGYSMPIEDHRDYIIKLSNQLGMSGEVEELACKTLEAAKEARLMAGRGKRGMAAAACYIGTRLCGQWQSQKDIAEIAKVTEVTVRNRYKELSKKLDFFVYL